MTENKKGFTIVEALIVTLIISLLSGIIYSFVSRAFQFSGNETKSIDAIQETALVFNYLKNDLKNIFENPYDEKTYAYFDDASKSFEFSIINGIADNNMQILSKVKYFFENNSLYRKIETYITAKKTLNSKIKLADKDKIINFNVKIYSSNGNLMSRNNKEHYPAFIKINFVHADNKRLLINSGIAVPQIRFTSAPLEKYRVESWKLKTIESGVLLAKINIGEIAFESVEYSRNSKFLQTRIGTNCGTPQAMQKPIVKKRAPFGGTNLNLKNPYTIQSLVNANVTSDGAGRGDTNFNTNFTDKGNGLVDIGLGEKNFDSGDKKDSDVVSTKSYGSQ